MLVSEIIDEVKEVTGDCSQTLNFRTITRAVELLANTKLVDPLIGYFEFSAINSLWVALPRDVKTVLRINISTNPSFARSRLFEFTQNTNGSQDDEEIGYSWANRGYLPVQDETKFPGKVAYVCESSEDEGKTAVIKGRDSAGEEIVEEVVAALSPSDSVEEFYQIDSISRTETAGKCSLEIGGDVIARFYGDELRPQYRIIKLSKPSSFVRVMFRKEVFKVTSLTDILPMDSAMAVIHAAKAVKFFKEENYDAGNASLTLAASFLTQEQAARDEADQLSALIETQSATDQIVASRDGLIVGDIYDAASSIAGSVGRRKVFDFIATAVELISNTAQWDSMIGAVDVFKEQTTGDGRFALPRFVEAVFAINTNGVPLAPRGQWFQFNLNGTGETNLSSDSKWDDLGETPIIASIPMDSTTKRPVPQRLAYVPSNAADEGKEITIFGYDENDREISETLAASVAPVASTNLFSRIDRIVRVATAYSCALVTLIGSTQTITLGNYYPDEVEPKYRAVKIDRASAVRIRVFYRRRETLITSMYQPIHLRSRLAVECAMRALKAMETDPAAAAMHIESAAQLLRDEMRSKNRSRSRGLQFVRSLMPGVAGNVQ